MFFSGNLIITPNFRPWGLRQGPVSLTDSTKKKKKSPQGRKFGVKGFQCKTCLDFVILSLHDTILSPSCMVRCPGVTERLVFLSTSNLSSLFWPPSHACQKKHRPPDTTSLKIPIWNYNTYWKKKNFYAPAKRKQWFQTGSTFTSIWPTDLLTTTSRLVFSLFWIPPAPEYWTLLTRMSVNWLILHHITFLTSEKKPTEKMVCI